MLSGTCITLLFSLCFKQCNAYSRTHVFDDPSVNYFIDLYLDYFIDILNYFIDTLNYFIDTFNYFIDILNYFIDSLF